MSPLELLTSDPYVLELLASPMPARFAYTALDGTPRVVPIAYHFNGRQFIMATAEKAPKVEALAGNRDVALTIDTETQPPKALLVRGTARVSIVEGVVPEYLSANRRMIPAENQSVFEAQVTELYDQMARIEVTPTWAKMLDFETRAPQAVMELAAEKERRGESTPQRR